MTSLYFTRFAKRALPFLWLSPGCNQAPIELRFESNATGDQRYLDRVKEAGVSEEIPEPAVPSSIVVTDSAVPRPTDTQAMDAGPFPSLEFSPGPACEDFPNECGDESRSKCTLVSEDPGYRSSCVPASGSLPIGASCNRRVRGDDDCEKGGFCSPTGQGFASENRLVCQRLCDSTDQCGEGERCVQLLSDEVVGLCVTECRVFQDEDCGARELRCVAAPEAGGGHFGYCEIFGNAGEGETCTLSSQCATGLSCEYASLECRQSCDVDHPCPDDRRCVTLELGEPNGLKLCVP